MEIEYSFKELKRTFKLPGTVLIPNTKVSLSASLATFSALGIKHTDEINIIHAI